jgi:hypothetical protein
MTMRKRSRRTSKFPVAWRMGTVAFAAVLMPADGGGGRRPHRVPRHPIARRPSITSLIFGWAHGTWPILPTVYASRRARSNRPLSAAQFARRTITGNAWRPSSYDATDGRWHQFYVDSRHSAKNDLSDGVRRDRPPNRHDFDRWRQTWQPGYDYTCRRVTRLKGEVR